MPDKQFPPGMISWINRKMVKLMPIKGIIVAAVFEFIADAAADLNSKLRSDRNLAFIKKPVNIASQQKAVIDRMRSRISVRLDMGRFKRGQSMLFCDSAGSLVGVGD